MNSISPSGKETAPRGLRVSGLARVPYLQMLGRLGVVVSWVVVILVFSLLKPGEFLTSSNVTTILASQAPLGILALALVIPLSVGDYDLSVASVLTLSGMVVAVLNVQHQWPIAAAIVAGVLVGAAAGLLNGLLCVLATLDPFIITLGTGTFIGGIVLWISNSAQVSGVSQWLVDAVVVRRLFGISLEFYYLLIVLVFIWYLLSMTPTGRRIVVIGKAREVARLSGIHVSRIRILSFTASGALSGLAGVVYVGTSGAADPTAGTLLLLPAFAAVFLGATTITPGRFNPWGTVISMYFLTTGINGLALIGISTYVQDLFYGGALVLAVLVASVARRGIRRKRDVSYDTTSAEPPPVTRSHDLDRTSGISSSALPDAHLPNKASQAQGARP